jgi:predicted phage-related endonuclease
MELTREIITYNTEAEWLAHRARDLTSTEAAGLFDVGVYANARTQYELYQIKSGALAPVPFDSNSRALWGNRLEAAIAAGIAEDLGLIVEPFKTYVRIPELRMGSSFDFKIVGLADGYTGFDESARDMFREHGPGIMEVKNVDGLAFRRAWGDEGAGIEAPAHIELQAQWQLEVADLNWSIIAPLVGGNSPVPIIRVRDLAVGNAIKLAAAEFWNRVDTGNAPPPDFTKDADTISRQYVDNDGSSIDLSDNMRVFELCRAYKKAAADAKDAAERKDAAKAELLTIIQYAKSVQATGFKISAGTNKASYRAYDRAAGERVTISVSQIPAARVEATVPPYRNVRVTEIA